MRDRVSLILFIFLILLLVIMAQNGTLGNLLADLSGDSGFSVTVQPGYPTVRPLSFATPTPRNLVLPPPALPTVYLPPAYPPTYPAAQPPQQQTPATNPTMVPSGAANGQCIVPNGWIAYTVQAGETLGTIAAAYNLTVEQLAAANCLQNPNLIYEGQILAVPGGQ